jgi:AAA family ATP:ADP antiporter
MKILDILKNKEPRYQGHLKYLLLSYFFVLFNYSLIKAATTTLFIDAFGAKASPGAWLWTVLFLTVSIFVFNRIQLERTVQKVMLLVSLFSTVLFFICFFGQGLGQKSFSYASFIWKEIYIVMQIHLLLGYANNYFKKEDFKAMVGLVGGIGSIGAILGGLLTTYLSKRYGTNVVAWTSLFFVFFPALLFLFTPELESREDKKVSPVQSLDTREIRTYVFHIALIVMLTQFVINIADFKFNLAFEKNIGLSSDRTAYLGYVYSMTNGLTFLFQFLFMPFFLPRISERAFHLFIPLSYLVCTGGLILTGGQFLLPVAAFYIYLKASDYSLFSAGKELLYLPLKGDQKYGAKYLTDMLVYRVSKALIAAVLIYLQTSSILNMMMITFLLLWLILVIRIFGIHRKLFS